MRLYFDTAYIAKCYLNEPAGLAVRRLARRAHFLEDLNNGVWILLPVTERILFRVDGLVSAVPNSVFLRSGDAIHLVTALEASFPEIWSNDRHLLGAAGHFGLRGRSV